MEDLLNDGEIAAEPTYKRQRSRTSISISSIRILTDEEIGRVKTKFVEEIEMVHTEAIRAHVSESAVALYTELT